MKHILVVPPTLAYPGSRGDQAVLLSTKDELARLNCRISVVVAKPDDAGWSFLTEEGVRMVNPAAAHPHDFDRVICLGTDVFDGAYSPKEFLLFEKTCAEFVANGKPAEIIGISIRPRVDAGLKKRAAQMGRRVRITVRDPVSYARFLEFSPVHPPVLVADPAFLLGPLPPPAEIRDWIHERKAGGLTCIGINVNRHLQEDAHAVASSMTALLREMAGCAFVLIPHDSRPSAGDQEMCRELFGTLAESAGGRVEVLPMLSAREIKGLCAHLDGVVTGRMHLAIAALGQGIPVLGIDYNFKMKGLFSYFGLQDWVVSPESLSAVVPAFPSAIDKLRAKVLAGIPRVRWLSQRNFSPGSVAGHAAYDSARFLAWSAAEHRPKWPDPIGPDQTVTQANLRAMLTIDYHRIEKGMAMPKPRTDFGQASGLVHRLTSNLRIYIERYGTDETAATVLAALRAYAAFSGWEPLQPQLAALESLAGAPCAVSEAGTVSVTRDAQLAAAKLDLQQFFGSRASIRMFSDEPVDDGEITRAVAMAHEGTPSVCNRQPYRVRVLTGASRAAALELQNGNRGFSETINKVLLVTVDTQFFETAAERNQPWIAGGLFCMSLMYALHSLGIATCSLNWDVSPLTDVALRERMALTDSEVLIMMIAVGHYLEQSTVARSRRVPVDQIVQFLD